MINNRYTLSIYHVSLMSVKFQLLLFSSQLNEVCSNYVTATGFEPTTSSYTNSQPFSQTGQMNELCCEYLFVECI